MSEATTAPRKVSRLATLPELVVPGGVFTDGDWVESKDQDPNGDVRLVQLADVGEGIYRDRSNRFLTMQKAKELNCTFLERGDILVARMPDPLGRACIFPGDAKPSVTAVDVCIVRSRSQDVNQRWLLGAINSPQFRSQVAALQSGTTRKRISRKNLGSIKIPVPPKDEQDLTCAIVEQQFTRLDAAVTALRRVKGNLKRYKSSVLQAACTGQLVPTEAGMAKSRGRHSEPADQLLKEILADREIASARTAARLKGKTTERPYRQPRPPNLSALPTPPDGWTWATVDQLAAPDRNSITDGPFGSNLKTSHYTSFGPRVIRLENIGDGAFVNEESHISEEHYANLMKHHVESQDLVIAALGKRLPRSCLVPGWLGPAIVKADCIRFKPSPRVSAKYLNFALNAEPTRQRAMATVHGVGRPRLNLGEIKEIAIPLPPTVEQERIVEEVDRRLSLIEELEAEVNEYVN